MSKKELDNKFEILLPILQKHADYRTNKEKRLLGKLIMKVKEVAEHLESTPNLEDFLVELTDIYEYKIFNKGESLAHRGNKMDRLIIILTGEANVYQQKSREAIQEQKDTRLNQIKPSSPFTDQRPNSQLSNDVISEATPRRVQPSNFIHNPNPIQKGNSIVSKLMKKNTLANLFKFEESIDKTDNDSYSHLSQEEQLLLIEPICRKKYLYEGASILEFCSVLGPENAIGEEAFFHDSRYSNTYVAKENIHSIVINRDAFIQLLDNQMQCVNEKIEFINKVFKASSMATTSKLLKCLKDVYYNPNEKIYSQGEESNGIYFIRTGQVRLSAEVTQKKYTEEEEELLKDKLTLMNQKNSFRRTVNIGILGQFDFFGEEDMLLNLSTRKYTAIATSSSTHLFYIEPNHYGILKNWCPERVRGFREVAESRNKWQTQQIRYLLNIKPISNSISSSSLQKSLPSSPKMKKIAPNSISEANLNVKLNSIVPGNSRRTSNAERIEKIYKQVMDPKNGQASYKVISESRARKESKEIPINQEIGLQQLMSNRLYLKSRNTKMRNIRISSLSKTNGGNTSKTGSKVLDQGIDEIKMAVTEAPDREESIYDGADHIARFTGNILKRVFKDSRPLSPIALNDSFGYIPPSRKSHMNIKSFALPTEINSPTSPNDTLELKKMVTNSSNSRPATTQYLSTESSTYSPKKLKFTSSFSRMVTSEQSMFSRPSTSVINKIASTPANRSEIIHSSVKQLQIKAHLKTSEGRHNSSKDLHSIEVSEKREESYSGPQLSRNKSAITTLNSKDCLIVKALNNQKFKIKSISKPIIYSKN